MGSPSLTCWLSSTCQLSKTTRNGGFYHACVHPQGPCGLRIRLCNAIQQRIRQPQGNTLSIEFYPDTRQAFFPCRQCPVCQRQIDNKISFNPACMHRKRRGNEIRLLQGSAVERKNACQPFYFEFSKSASSSRKLISRDGAQTISFVSRESKWAALSNRSGLRCPDGYQCRTAVKSH